MNRPAKAPAEISLVTATRSDLFKLSAALVLGIELEFLQDRERPVLVSVRGSFAGGKKIFPDAAHRVLLSSSGDYAFRGVKEWDEYWTGTVNGKKTEVSFININKTNGFSDKTLDDIWSQGCLIKSFLRLRRSGGVAFIHNSNEFGEDEAGIDIRLIAPRLSFLEAAAGQPERAVCAKWARRVEIRVKDSRLLGSAKFQQALRDIESGLFRKKSAYGNAFAFAARVRDASLLLQRRFGRKTQP